MVGYDRGLSLAMGRQCAIQEQEFVNILTRAYAVTESAS